MWGITQLAFKLRTTFNSACAYMMHVPALCALALCLSPIVLQGLVAVCEFRAGTASSLAWAGCSCKGGQTTLSYRIPFIGLYVDVKQQTLTASCQPGKTVGSTALPLEPRANTSTHTLPSTADSSIISAHNSTPQPSELLQYITQHGVRAPVYAACLLAAPRMAMTGLLLYDRTAVGVLQRIVVDWEGATQRVLPFTSRWLRHTAQPLPSPQASSHGEPPTSNSNTQYNATTSSDNGSSSSSSSSSSSTVRPGALSTRVWWSLWVVCPSGLLLHASMSLAQQAPVSAAGAVLVALLQALCELALMAATTRRLYQRQWGRALSSQFIAYGAAMGLCLNCLCVLNMLGWVLPASLLGFAVRYMAVGSAFMTCLVMLLQAQHRAAEVLMRDLAQRFGAMAEQVGHMGDHLPGVPFLPASPTRPAAAPIRAHWPTALKLPKELPEDLDIPRHFTCPITHCLMREPAVTAMGATYERSTIVEWLRANRKDPLTSAPLSEEQVYPNLSMYTAIEEWLRTVQ